jgi:hypothetical protein
MGSFPENVGKIPIISFNVGVCWQQKLETFQQKVAISAAKKKSAYFSESHLPPW